MLRLKSSRTDAGSTPFIDMTPMIDMVFQLLIFFLLTSIFAAQPALDLTLPSAEHAKEEAREESVHLFIQKEGTIFIDEEEISLEGLGAALQALMPDTFAANPDLVMPEFDLFAATAPATP